MQEAGQLVHREKRKGRTALGECIVSILLQLGDMQRVAVVAPELRHSQRRIDALPVERAAAIFDLQCKVRRRISLRVVLALGRQQGDGSDPVALVGLQPALQFLPAKGH